jgi:hypothetical protein
MQIFYIKLRSQVLYVTKNTLLIFTKPAAMSHSSLN